jgi:ubiquinone/menaquinone biosynthesis C-methylase UbiE
VDERLEHNKKMWNALTEPHVKSAFYDVAGFKAGKDWLKPLEIAEVGDVRDKSLLHLQCHFGMDTISWGRRGAEVTGIDFSDAAIAQARKLAKETGVKAEFICSDIFALPEVLNKEFDIVFTSYGALGWLPDLNKWGKIVAHFLKPGGFFYIAEFHPLFWIFGQKPNPEMCVYESYFHHTVRFEEGTDYASDFTHKMTSYEWQFTIGDVITALGKEGLCIEYLHELPICCFQARKDMKQDKDGWWRLEGDMIPLTFSIKATKPMLKT